MPYTLDEHLTTYAEEVITIDDTSRRLSLSNLYSTPQCRKVEMFLSTAQIRFRMDGTDPTSTVGDILNPFDRLTTTSMNNAENFRAIRLGTTNGSLRVKYLR